MNEGSNDLNELYNKSKQQLQNQNIDKEENFDEYADLRNKTNNVDDKKETVKIENKPMDYDKNVAIENKQQTYEELPEDKPVFPGGPMLSQVMMWKKQFVTKKGQYTYGKVFVTEIKDFGYVVLKSLKRGEYTQINSILSANAYTREEYITNICCLYPSMPLEEMHLLDSGIPSSIAQIVMENSGFVKDYKMQVL